ncbi:MAG: SUF system NifU family Fe-S cluster assembly protein [Opitutales bacterium]|nr:SUF system NifU family Fe-S cluster assembly protein [Opitutales bacterium]
MSEVSELYQEIIIDHSGHPHHEGIIKNPTCQAEGYNATCGDEIKVSLVVEDGKIADIKFYGQGCAISRASGSMMTDFILGMSISEAQKFSSKIQQWLNQENVSLAEKDCGDLQALASVKQFPMRIKCATLAWHTLDQALQGVV